MILLNKREGKKRKSLNNFELECFHLAIVWFDYAFECVWKRKPND